MPDAYRASGASAARGRVSGVDSGAARGGRCWAVGTGRCCQHNRDSADQRAAVASSSSSSASPLSMPSRNSSRSPVVVSLREAVASPVLVR